jgi:hypothetical protein
LRAFSHVLKVWQCCNQRLVHPTEANLKLG